MSGDRPFSELRDTLPPAAQARIDRRIALALIASAIEDFERAADWARRAGDHALADGLARMRERALRG